MGGDLIVTIKMRVAAPRLLGVFFIDNKVVALVLRYLVPPLVDKITGGATCTEQVLVGVCDGVERPTEAEEA
jgi:hypothetical protein